MKRSIGRRVATLLASTCLLLSSQVPAYAGTSISIGGNSDWKVTATATTNTNSVKQGRYATGTATISFTARILGIPLPNTGYYANSFPITFARPSLLSSNGNINSTTYQKMTNQYLGRQQWEVRGSQGFWGDMSVTVKGQARALTVSSGRYFYAGTISCGKNCTNANAIQRLNVTR